MLETIGMVCLGAAMLFGVAAVQNRKPGVPLQPSRWASPLNHIFGGDVFTPRGEKFRITALVLGASGILCIILYQAIWS